MMQRYNLRHLSTRKAIVPNFPKVEVIDGIHMFVQAKPKRRWRRLYGLALFPYWTGVLVAVEINADVRAVPPGSSNLPFWCDLLGPGNTRVRVIDGSLGHGQHRIMTKSVYLDKPGDWRYELMINSGRRDEKAPVGDFTVFAKDTIVFTAGFVLIAALLAIVGDLVIRMLI
jgi:hypothetical protein